MSNTTTNTHKTKSSIFHRWVKQTFFRPRLSGLPCIYRLYRNYYNDLHCQDYCGITTPSKLTPQKCTLQKSFLWQLLWLTRHTFRPDAFLASPAAQRPRQLCLFKKRREDVGGKKRPCAPLRPLVWFPVYTTYVDLWHVCACCCLRLRRRVEGAGPQLEASGSQGGGGGGPGGGSHSPQSDSPTGIVRTWVTGVLVVERNSANVRRRRATAAVTERIW